VKSEPLLCCNLRAVAFMHSTSCVSSILLIPTMSAMHSASELEKAKAKLRIQLRRSALLLPHADEPAQQDSRYFSRRSPFDSAATVSHSTVICRPHRQTRFGDQVGQDKVPQ